MSAYTNSSEINAFAALTRSAPGGVVSAIEKASARTGVDFAYLVQQAKAESSFNPDAKAKTSSATGLYQFLESTWLGMVRDHGEKYGLGDYASFIDARGKVADPAKKAEILELRKDPSAASLLAAEFAVQNKLFLERNWGGKVGATELYFAHFMGAGGAAGFLKAKDEDPLAFGADLFPREARANRNVFYNPATGKPRTLAEIYDFFDRKFAIGNSSPAQAIADDAPRATPSRVGVPPTGFLSTTQRPQAGSESEAVRSYLHIMAANARSLPSPFGGEANPLASLDFLSGPVLLSASDALLLGELKNTREEKFL